MEEVIKEEIKIQLVIPNKPTNKTLRLEKVKGDFKTTKEIASKILIDACEMIDYTGEMVDETLNKMRKKNEK